MKIASITFNAVGISDDENKITSVYIPPKSLKGSVCTNESNITIDVRINRKTIIRGNISTRSINSELAKLKGRSILWIYKDQGFCKISDLVFPLEKYVPLKHIRKLSSAY